MKKVFYVYMSLMMCMFASCQKDEDVIPEPQPQPEPEKPVVRYAEYETTDDNVDFGVGNFMIATKNLGAKRPEDTGLFFAWGETEPKEVYSWETYKLQSSNLYYKDNALLQPQDDAATVILGEGWRLPTVEEVRFLHDMYTTDENCCRMRPTLKNGVYGFMLIGPNGNSVFFPSTGRMQGNELITWDNDTKMWCKDCTKGRELKVFSIELTGVSTFWTVNRSEGLPIRPVKERGAAPDTVYLKLNVLDRNIADAQNLLSTINPAEYSAESYQALDRNYQRAVAMRTYAVENDGQKLHSYLGLINNTNKELQDSIDHASHFLALAMFDLSPLPKPSDIKAVDLGLSVRWASANIGARTETEYGYFIAWGELTPKQTRYEWENYKFCKEVYEGDRDYSKFSKYVTDSRWGEVDGKTRLDLEDDAAHEFLGGNWHIPTPEEFQELVDNCTFENVTLNGQTVMKATGPNGNYIYFPHTGSTNVMDEIYCWTTDMVPGSNQRAICYSIQSFWGEAYKTWDNRYVGMTIRAVCP
ncbi:MAG: hypothetical protein J6T44_04105 [Prevotella sp.]|nr:hypothetical protein [Prevotella sp.]